MNTLPALLYSMTIDRALAGIRARIPEFSGMKPGDRVLDVCCGTGAQSFCYAGRGIISWGIDLDPGMIEFAENRRTRLGLDSTFFQRASAMNLPFRDASFDHASISMGLHEKEGASRDGIISEMRRVVKRMVLWLSWTTECPIPRTSMAARSDSWSRWRAGTISGASGIPQDGGLDSLLIRHHLHEEEGVPAENAHGDGEGPQRLGLCRPGAARPGLLSSCPFASGAHPASISQGYGSASIVSWASLVSIFPAGMWWSHRAAVVEDRHEQHPYQRHPDESCRHHRHTLDCPRVDRHSTLRLQVAVTELLPLARLLSI